MSKPILHNSQIDMAFKCGEQFRRRYIEGEKRPPGIALIVGTSTHKVSTVSLNYKLDHSGELMSIEDIRDCARDSFVRSWEENGVQLTKDETKIGLNRIKGDGIDTTIKLSEAHRIYLAPVIQPVEIEWKWVINCDGYPYDLAGECDVNEPDNIRDLKTSAKMLSQSEADISTQLTMYSLAWFVNKGKYPKKVMLDVITKAQNTKIQTLISERDESDIQVFLRRFEQICTMLEKGVFLPANQKDWWCSEKWCGYATTCPYFSGRKTVSVTETIFANISQEQTIKKQGETKNAGRKTISKRNSESIL